MLVVGMLARSTPFAALSGTLIPACITQDVTFEVPPDHPPSIESPPTAEHPINQIIVLEPGAPAGDGGPGSNSIFLDVEIRDANLTQRLRYRLFIDYRRGDLMPGFTEQPIPPSNSLVRVERIEVPVRPYLSNPGCHRIELFVSSNFQPAGPTARLPQTAGDLATATWWVATRDPAAPMGVVDMTNCPE